MRDGRVVVTGYALTDTFIVRLDAGGALDASFGTDGRVHFISARPFHLMDSLILDDGRLLLVGFHDWNDHRLRRIWL